MVYVERADFHGRIEYRVLEPKTDGSVKELAAVRIYPPDKRFYEHPAEVSWPSTSDKRPELAAALGQALIMAAAEAQLMTATEVEA